LNYFVQHAVGSTYQCYKYMNQQKIKISYKNVHKKVQNLSQLDIIKVSKSNLDKVGGIPSKHGAIYYKLSQYGIFHNLKRTDAFVTFISTFTMSDYMFDFENFVLYKHILYPYIKLQTVKQLKTFYVLYRIVEYLQRCCVDLESVFSQILESKKVEKENIKQVMQDYLKKDYKPKLQDNLIKLCLSVLSLNLSHHQPTSSDIVLLKNDANFYGTVYGLKQSIDNIYNEFEKLRT
jgi:hypothetical protein